MGISYSFKTIFLGTTYSFKIIFMGTSYSALLYSSSTLASKISDTTVYICPFTTNEVKMKTIFSLKVTIKVTFNSKKRYSMIIVLT